ncbi:MAG: hypothetical protein GY765_20110 [bacterium]|nr:hypothetical protein [bacterium]
MKFLNTIKGSTFLALTILTLIFAGTVFSCFLMLPGNTAESKSILLISAGGMLVFLLAALLYFLSVKKTLAVPVSRMQSLFNEVYGGNMEARFRKEKSSAPELNRLGEAFNGIIGSFARVITRAGNATREVLAAAEDISVGSKDLSTRTTEEAASITQTSATLEELTTIVKKNRESSEETGTTLISFNKEIQSRNDLMTDVTNTMKDIHESGKKIDDIVRVINDISFQTNLLALNAAVEAARAGEAGRGFAVVAAEVRNLAQKTAESSKTIQNIVSENVESTERGLDLVNQTTEFFSTIVKVMQDIVEKISLIAESSKEQAIGVEQINEAVSQLEMVINQNSALVEELSSNANTMKASSSELQELVEGVGSISEEVETYTPRSAVTDSKPVSQSKKKPTVSPSKKKIAASADIKIPLHQSKVEKVTEDDFFSTDEDFEEF